MNDKDVAARINEVAKLTEEKQNTEPYDGLPAKMYSIGDGYFAFNGNNTINKLTTLFDICWKGDKEIYQCYSQKTIEDTVVGLIHQVKSSGDNITFTDVQQTFQKLKSVYREPWEVLRTVYGVKLKGAVPLVLGPYRLYKYHRNKQDLLFKYPHASSILEMHLHEIPDDSVMIGTTVKTVDASRAIDIADDLFRQFENVIRFMIPGMARGSDVGVFDYNRLTHFSALALSPTLASGQSEIDGAFHAVELNDPLFVDERAGHAWIWRVIEKTDMTKLERKILSGIEWYGKAIRDPDPAKSFVQFMFALEAVLTFKEKDILVSPSVSNQISEFAAFIIGTDYENRAQVENDVKALYGIRSAIVHGGSKVVSTDDIYKVGLLVKTLIVTLTTNEELRGLTSIEQLQQWVKRKRYG